MKIIFEETSRLQIVHPITEEPLEASKGKPMEVEFYGKHTATFKAADLARRRSAAKRINGKNLKKMMTSALDDNESSEADDLRLLTSCVVAFHNMDELETENGKIDPKDISGTLDTVFWIRDQVDAGIADLENFMAKPKKA